MHRQSLQHWCAFDSIIHFVNLSLSCSFDNTKWWKSFGLLWKKIFHSSWQHSQIPYFNMFWIIIFKDSTDCFIFILKWNWYKMPQSYCLLIGFLSSPIIGNALSGLFCVFLDGMPHDIMASLDFPHKFKCFLFFACTCIVCFGGKKNDSLPRYYFPTLAHQSHIHDDAMRLVGAWK